MMQIGVIGCGRIGGPVVDAIQNGRAGNSTLIAVLTRREKSLGTLTTGTDPEAFFDRPFDLIIEAASADSLREHGVRALRHADVWTINPAALADPRLYQELQATGREHGHRLRILGGAIAGLDGVSALSIDNQAEVVSVVEVAPSDSGRTTLFEGSAREAAVEYPDSVNVGVAAALAGPGLDAARVEVVQPGPGEGRKLQLSAHSQYGQVEVSSAPVVNPERQIHTVAACIIAALRREDEVIWVG